MGMRVGRARAQAVSGKTVAYANARHTRQGHVHVLVGRRAGGQADRQNAHRREAVGDLEGRVQG